MWPPTTDTNPQTPIGQPVINTSMGVYPLPMQTTLSGTGAMAHYMPLLPSNAEVKDNLQQLELAYRTRSNRDWAGKGDNGKSILHPLRLEPWPNLNPAELFKIGLAFAKTNRAPPLPFDMSHLNSGMLIDGRAFHMAASLSDGNLLLQRFLPGTFSDSTSSKKLQSMRKATKAFHVYASLVRRTRVWDLTPEVCWDFIVEQDLFSSDQIPYAGFYRMPDHKPHEAVVALVESVHRTFIELLGHTPKMLDYAAVEQVHKNRCLQWSNIADV